MVFDFSSFQREESSLRDYRDPKPPSQGNERANKSHEPIFELCCLSCLCQKAISQLLEEV